MTTSLDESFGDYMRETHPVRQKRQAPAAGAASQQPWERAGLTREEWAKGRQTELRRRMAAANAPKGRLAQAGAVAGRLGLAAAQGVVNVAGNIEALVEAVGPKTVAQAVAENRELGAHLFGVTRGAEAALERATPYSQTAAFGEPFAEAGGEMVTAGAVGKVVGAATRLAPLAARGAAAVARRVGAGTLAESTVGSAAAGAVESVPFTYAMDPQARGREVAAGAVLFGGLGALHGVGRGLAKERLARDFGIEDKVSATAVRPTEPPSPRPAAAVPDRIAEKVAPKETLPAPTPESPRGRIAAEAKATPEPVATERVPLSTAAAAQLNVIRAKGGKALANQITATHTSPVLDEASKAERLAILTARSDEAAARAVELSQVSEQPPTAKTGPTPLPPDLVAEFGPKAEAAAAGPGVAGAAAEPTPVATPSLYHETATDYASGMIEGNRSAFQVGPMGQRELYFADRPELALGQGRNRGVLIELAPEGIPVKPNLSKPGLEPVRASGGGTEYVSRDYDPTQLAKNVKAITLRPEVAAATRDPFAIRIRRRLGHEGWAQESLPDGSLRYTRPLNVSAEPAPMLAQAERAVTKAAPEPTPAGGLSVQFLRRPAEQMAEVPLHAPTPEIEARMREALKGVQEPSLADRFREGLRTFYHGITRTFPELPRTGRWAPALHELTRLPNRWANAGATTVKRMRHNTIGFDRPTMGLFTEKVLADDLTATLAQNPEAGLPFGLTPETLPQYKAAVEVNVAKNPLIAERLAQRQAHWDEVKDAHVRAYGDLGIDVSDRYNRPDYMHHLVLDYAEARRIGTKGGRRLQVPMREGFMRQRRGSAKDIALDYFQYEFESMARMQAATETARTLKNIQDAGYDIRPTLEAEARKTEGQDWHDLIPETHTTWQPRPGNAMFQVDTLPETLVRQLLDASAELPVEQAAFRKLLALGSRFREWVIPNELAKTLDDFMAPGRADPIHRALQTATQTWKQYVLLNPRRALPFNFRNATGDLEPVLQRNPRSLLKFPRAFSELYNIYTREVAATGDLANWMRDAGPGGQLMAQELGDLRKIESFRSLLPQMEKGNWAGRAWRRYWWVMRKATDFRESVLRYANYLDYKEQMVGNAEGRPRNFGASKAEEVMALGSPHDRALKLSNELLGAYDQTSHLGQSLSRYYIPFWRWIEINTSRTAGIWRNVLTERDVGAAGRIVTMSTAKRAAQAVIGASLTSAYTTAWNMLRFPEEEKQLPSYVRGRPHIILGKNVDGSIRYIGRLGSMSDLLDWFGADTARSEVKAYLNGEISLAEMAATMAKAPVQKVYDGLSPTLKNIPEVLGGYTGYPDVTHPRRMRSRMEYLGQQFSATPEVRLLRSGDISAYLRDVKEATFGETVARPTTRAGEVMRQIAAEESPQYTFTPAERRASALKWEAVKAIRAGKAPPTRFSELAPAAQGRAIKEASMTEDEAMLRKLKTPQMLRVYAAGNQDERDRYLPLITSRILNSYKTGNTTKEQAAEYLQRLTELTARPVESKP